MVWSIPTISSWCNVVTARYTFVIVVNFENLLIKIIVTWHNKLTFDWLRWAIIYKLNYSRQKGGSSERRRQVVLQALGFQFPQSLWYKIKSSRRSQTDWTEVTSYCKQCSTQFFIKNMTSWGLYSPRNDPDPEMIPNPESTQFKWYYQSFHNTRRRERGTAWTTSASNEPRYFPN